MATSFANGCSIALVKNHIRIVQASLVGSILVNLLLILGMSFFIGGLRFREQIYNSKVTQMSACLLSLSVTSLLLPTAFHASFSSETKADDKVLQVSRGTSVIVLVVYFLYLVFQLKSHSYIYASTPQELVERQAVPGPAAQYFRSHHGSDGSTSDSESGASSPSATSSRRIRRIVRRGKRVARSTGSKTAVATPISSRSTDELDLVPHVPADCFADEVGESSNSQNLRPETEKLHRHPQGPADQQTLEPPPTPPDPANDHGTARFDFATGPALEAQASPSQPPSRFSTLASPTTKPRRTNSEPSCRPQHHHHHHHHHHHPHHHRQDPTMPPLIAPSVYTTTNHSHPANPNQPNSHTSTSHHHHHHHHGHHHHHRPLTSRAPALALLVLTTALVATNAEFMISSIDSLLTSPSPPLSEAFIGLILLPLVGNAAEHVTAVSVATRNKMDLAIGVAVGSSLQIALLVTPAVVLLGWGLGKEMGLFFTLFETVCVFVSAFIVNFLVLDGRSNYLEGALLCAGYVIVAVAAFFYPGQEAANAALGGEEGGG